MPKLNVKKNISPALMNIGIPHNGSALKFSCRFLAMSFQFINTLCQM